MSGTGWSTRVAAGEATANVTSSSVRSLLIAAVAAVLAAAVVACSVAELAAIQGRFRDQVARGRFVLVARSVGSDGLDAGRCDALRDLEGVRSAGAILHEDPTYPLAAPLRPYDRLVVTPGLLAVWFPTSAGATDGTGLAVGADAAAELGLVPGAYLQTASTASRSHERLRPGDDTVARHRIVTVLPAAIRDPEAGRMLFETAAPTGTASACFVDPDPSARTAVEATLVGWFGRDQPASVAPLLDERQTGRQPEAELAGRAARWVWLTAALAISALMVVLWYGRREEFALYRLLGLRRRSIGLLLVVESTLIVALPGLVGAAIALVTCLDPLTDVAHLDAGSPGLLSLVAADAASFAAALVLLPLGGWVAVALRSTFDVLKGS
ncbi:MAG: hypothetical protein JWO77_1406 [Ilumatobacteraceae bacterium]|nr:hypothetical protein [Ilumatobacteraceae bacterium]